MSHMCERRCSKRASTSGVNTPDFTKLGGLRSYSIFGSRKMTDEERELEKSTNEMAEHDFARPEMQEARAFLRERFLRAITGVVGKPSEFNLHENSRVTGEFRGCDVDGLEVYVRDLKTPLGKVPQAILRTTDIVHFTVKDVASQQ